MLIVIIVINLFELLSCEDFVEVETPRNEIVSANVFNNDATAISAISGIYSNMINGNLLSFSSTAMDKFGGLSADEFFSNASSDLEQQFALNALLPTNGQLASTFWGDLYEQLVNANAIIEGLEESTQLTPSVKEQLEGEAKFIRAFYHFYLVNMFGPVPVVTSTNVEVNNTASRIPIEQVYEQILIDLLDAEELMENNFDTANGERVRPNRGTAQALLARVYLYVENWAKAEEYATNLINNTALYGLESNLNNVFLANSVEAIWQLKPNTPENFITPQAARFILTTAPSNRGLTVALTNDLFNAFEPGDLRQINWIGTVEDGGTFYFPFKYKNVTIAFEEYSVVFRLAEQYLIRAEARAQQNNLPRAIEDLDLIRQRAGLTLITDTNPGILQSDLLLAIEQERRVEMFTEWGHRWFDLKRTGRADAILGPKKINWESTDVLYPISEAEILENPNLLPQNDGY
ncbi:RagB/SusD family nutrient uptake outer membrane protein [Flagellimonas sp. CMM7]|uniref:RagB/SusD family nutrient uptake outer membrane protein n=1 Tax=Flagellimonas sp. CMM7 TaxID=2654676 RepID=UPI0013D1FD42|nr:RagB/SusD family nutrient uptake outer membrane protein [Flagellimonas sp. CMM7]UII80286.1 RagB/SusD family nutrient uptake outer membrane protein [Flagellimonas sp. CMM7]